MFFSPEDAAQAFNICSKIINKEFALLNTVEESQIALKKVHDNKKLQKILSLY